VDYRDSTQDPWGIGRAIQAGTEIPRTPMVDLSQRLRKLKEQHGIEHNPRIETFDFCNRITWWNPEMIAPVIKDYERFFNTNFNYTKLYPLYNTYILPVEIYEKVMSWIVQLYDKIYHETMRHDHMRSIPGRIAIYYERIMAFAIGQENIRSIQITSVEHDHFYKNALPT
jgi:hypothetical protein